MRIEQEASEAIRSAIIDVEGSLALTKFFPPRPKTGPAWDQSIGELPDPVLLAAVKEKIKAGEYGDLIKHGDIKLIVESTAASADLGVDWTIQTSGAIWKIYSIIPEEPTGTVAYFNVYARR